MTVTFQTERWPEFVKDADDIFPIHWRELALDQEEIVMDIDYQTYERIDREGILHIVTVRDSGKLVGYHMGLIVVHPHYKMSGLMATTDMFYLVPGSRKGGLGAKMLLFVEEKLRERGVKKAFIGTKLHQNHSELFIAMGWTPTDMTFSKLL